MGGGPKQVDAGVAKSSSAGAEAQATASANLANQMAAQQKSSFSTLFGTPALSGGAPTGDSVLGQFLQPGYLSAASSGLQGPYAQQYAQAKGVLANSQAQQQGQLAQSLQNRGFGMGSGSGLAGSLGMQQALGQAQQQGQQYSDYQNQGYQDALRNLWSAAGIMSGQGTSAGAGAMQGLGQAGQTYSNLYGTAGKQAQGSSLMGSLIGAGGSILGGAMSGGLICYVAAKVFGEPDDLSGLKTGMVRQYMYSHLSDQGIKIYQKFGKEISEQPEAVESLAPYFEWMLERAEEA